MASSIVSVTSDTTVVAVMLEPAPVLTVTLAPTPSVAVSVLQRGPQGNDGNQGIQGVPGIPGSAASFTYLQNVPSAQWTVVHNLGRRPSVTVIDSANDEILADPYFVDSNTIILTFGAVLSGIAYCI